jgi:ribosomal protein L37AE/L43A
VRSTASATTERRHGVKPECPDCSYALPGDGSCCDRCGWTLVGGGDDPRLPSDRPLKQIVAEVLRRAIWRRVPLTIDDMYDAAAQLRKSSKGTHALRALLRWLDADGLSLDQMNRLAVFTLLEGAWGPFAGSARDAMREVLGE